MARQEIVIRDFDLGAVFLPKTSPIVRDRPRPVRFRQPGYDEAFDFHCVFYDTFFTNDNQSIRLVGPSMFNLAPYIEGGKVDVTDTETGDKVDVLDYRVHHLNKVSRLDIKLSRQVSQATCHLTFGELGQFAVAVSQNLCSLFTGKKVAFTLFKYEPLDWLHDWAEFNVKYHGANALLVNHNNCPHATADEIAETFSGIDGLDTVMVVHWPYLYGPQAAGTGYWDSNFCQLGLFEQMRWRSLSTAAGVLNGDIDELVITKGHVSIFDLLGQAKGGCIEFDSIPISNGRTAENTAKFESRRHKDYFHTGDRPKGGRPSSKWAIVPSMHGEAKQWMVHNLAKHASPKDQKDMAVLCHFRDINVQWKLSEIPPLGNSSEFTPLREAYELIGWR